MLRECSDGLHEIERHEVVRGALTSRQHPDLKPAELEAVHAPPTGASLHELAALSCTTRLRTVPTPLEADLFSFSFRNIASYAGRDGGNV